MTFGPPRAVLVVSEEAILTDQGRKYVLVVNDRNVAERRPVTLGQLDKDMRTIEKRLGAEEWVVTPASTRSTTATRLSRGKRLRRHVKALPRIRALER
jgi:multidrug efflux pump subunit AcrA (membrane-fusion protein)